MSFRLCNRSSRLSAPVSVPVSALIGVVLILVGAGALNSFFFSGIATVKAQTTAEESAPNVEALDVPPGEVSAGDAELGSEEVRKKRRKHVRKQRERADRRVSEQGEGAPRAGKSDWIRMKRQMLEFSDRYFESVQDPNRALGFAALGIKDHYRRRGKPEQAVPEIEAILAQTKDQKARNVLLFILRQIHEAEGSEDQFMALNKQIVAENLKQLSKE